ncbi:FAD-dependent pyridine nucleotide-disulfide oxidoreductase [Hyaloraphidium curvatum]|nr:FAD-dependent pyridine nucleotide-disulfide oxidoreductase [Hyaloraphidium curvatum]
MASAEQRAPLTIVAVGGVAGGSTAATKARRENEDARIIVLEKGPHISFSNCGLPFYLGGKVGSRDKLFLTNPAKMHNRYGIEACPNHEVVSIDRKAKVVTVKTAEGIETVEYDKLILSQGADAIISGNLPGVHASNVMPLKTVPDADHAMALIHKLLPKGGAAVKRPEDRPHAVIVGCGYIGLEVAAEFLEIGMQVTCVDLVPQVLPTFDPDMAQYVERQLRAKGVDVVLGDGVKSFVTETHEVDGQQVEVATAIELTSGRKIECDIAILSIGVKPDTSLARAAGLEIGPTGGVVINEFCQTVTDPDVYCTGDMAEITHLLTGKKVRIALAGPANKMGRVAGANAAAEKPYLRFPGALGTSIIGVLGVTAAMTGLSEKQCAKEGIDYGVAIAHANNHTGVYPGAKQMHMKVLFEEKSGRLLGAQAVGEAGVDKRIDIIATALYAKLAIHDLEDLDLAYAPQYGAAKDPVNILGWVASNVRTGYLRASTYPEMVETVRAAGPGATQFIDVRDADEVERDGVPKVPDPQAKWVHIPVDTLRHKLAELDPKKPAYLLCHSGLRSYLGCRILMQHGFDAINIQGGMLQVPVDDRSKL